MAVTISKFVSPFVATDVAAERGEVRDTVHLQRGGIRPGDGPVDGEQHDAVGKTLHDWLKRKTVVLSGGRNVLRRLRASQRASPVKALLLAEKLVRHERADFNAAREASEPTPPS